MAEGYYRICKKCGRRAPERLRSCPVCHSTQFEYKKEQQPTQAPPAPTRRPRRFKGPVVNKRTGRPVGPYIRSFGQTAGKGARAVGRGAFELGAGFAEGIRISKPSVRGIGKFTGEATRAGVKTLSRVRLREPGHFWGPGYASSTEAKQPISHLPVEVQTAMIQYIADLYPQLYYTLYKPGMTISGFIGTLRSQYPDLYEEVKASIYGSIGKGYPQPGFGRGYAQPGFGRPLGV